MNIIQQIKHGQISSENKILFIVACSCIASFVIGFFSYNPMMNLLREREVEQEQIAEQEAVQVQDFEMDLGEYTGGLYNGMRNGWGQLKTKKGNVYEGEWRDNVLSEGTMECEFGFYEGQFGKALFPHGWGVMEYRDSIYAGNWYGGNKKGYGRVIYPDGSSVVSIWDKGIKIGATTPSQCRDSILYGIDVSKYQANMDWDNLAIFTDKEGMAYRNDPVNKNVIAPVSFVYIKATQSIGTDPLYDSHYKEAKRHLVVKGSYHFYDLRTSAQAQAENFLSNSKYEKGDLPPMLDIEVEAQFGKGDKKAKDVQTMREEALEWLRIVESKLGVKPIIYVSDRFYTSYIKPDPRLQDYRAWIARYNNVPPKNDEWFIWQMTDKARLPGMKDNDYIDVNMFRGNARMFNAMFGLDNIYYTRKSRFRKENFD